MVPHADPSSNQNPFANPATQADGNKHANIHADQHGDPYKHRSGQPNGHSHPHACDTTHRWSGREPKELCWSRYGVWVDWSGMFWSLFLEPGSSQAREIGILRSPL